MVLKKEKCEHAELTVLCVQACVVAAVGLSYPIDIFVNIIEL